MKTTIFRQIFFTLLILAFSILYFECGVDSTIDIKTPPPQPISCISGQISDWTYGGKMTLQFLIQSATNQTYPVASCLIDAQGKFNICLPSTLSDTTLFPADILFCACCPGGVITNPPNTKGIQIWNMNVYNADTLFGSIKKCNYTTIGSGTFEAMYIYVNKNVTISGSKYCDDDTLQFNGTAVTGWNEITKNYIRVSSSGNTILYNNNEPSGPYWRLTLLE